MNKTYSKIKSRF